LTTVGIVVVAVVVVTEFVDEVLAVTTLVAVVRVMVEVMSD
jgi:hypothetical protein